MMFGDFIANLKASLPDVGRGEASPDAKGDYMDWQSYIVRDNDSGKERYLKVQHDNDGNILAVRDYSKKNPTTYTLGRDIERFFKNNFDMDATNYTVSSAPVDITDPSKIPDDYHEKATVFFDSSVDGQFRPLDVFNGKNYGIRQFGDRKAKRYAARTDTNVPSFEKAYREAMLYNNTMNRGRYDQRSMEPLLDAPTPLERYQQNDPFWVWKG